MYQFSPMCTDVPSLPLWSDRGYSGGLCDPQAASHLCHLAHSAVSAINLVHRVCKCGLCVLLLLLPRLRRRLMLMMLCIVGHLQVAKYFLIFLIRSWFSTGGWDYINASSVGMTKKTVIALQEQRTAASIALAGVGWVVWGAGEAL